MMRTYEDRAISDEIRLIYLELLCKSAPGKVIDELKTGHYPIDDSLVICRQYKIIEGIAYIL